MIKLYQFPRNKATHNFSPFCLKLETYLKMSETPYEIKSIVNPGGAPKKKLPFIEIDGEKIGDSGLIISHLESKNGGRVDGSLSPNERARGVTLIRTFENSLMAAVVYSRWLDDEGWKHCKVHFFASLPAPLKLIIPGQVRKGVRKTLWLSGPGRNSQEEIYTMGFADLDAISDLLGDNEYFLGNTPHTVDATAFGFLNNIIKEPFDNPLRKHARTKANFAPYIERMHRRFFPKSA
jgi:glutathione S-transferase